MSGGGPGASPSRRPGLALPTVETCPWRAVEGPEGSRSRARCGLVGSLLGVEDEGLVGVSADACAACCREFPPTRRAPNPVVAGLLHAAASKVASAGGVPGCDLVAATRAREFAAVALDVSVPEHQRVTPARGVAPCSWLGAALDGPASACDHPSHDVATPDRCRGCPDWSRLRPISRRMTPEELIPLPAGRRGPAVRTWAVGVTTAPRKRSTLDACLDGLARAGWDSPRLFLDGTVRISDRHSGLPISWRDERVGAWPSWFLALAELVVQEPDADAYLMLQDDVALLDHAPLRDYLERALWPGDKPGLVSLFYSGPESTPGWHRRDGAWHWGAQAFVLPPGLARGLLADPEVVRSALDCSVDRHTPIPTVLEDWANRRGVDAWFATPSPSQHIGNASAIWAHATLTGGRRAPWFAGSLEDPFAIEESLADFPEAAFPCEPAALDAYRRRVGRGRDRMRGSTAVVLGLCRDARHHLPRFAARVERLGSMFRDYRVVLVEGGSIDASAEFLRDWQAVNPRVEVLGEPPGSPGGRKPDRARWLARCRDRYRDRAVEAHAALDFAVVVDLGLAGGWSVDGVAHSFGEDDWDFIGSLGLARDPASDRIPAPLLHRDRKSYRPGPGTSPIRPSAPPARGSPVVPVESCFGGLGVYRMACLLACSYSGEGQGIGVDADSEHVAFHRRLGRVGLGRRFLNPSQVALHSPA